MSYPAEFLYTREHEWVRIEGDIAVLGITMFAQQELGEIVFIELPTIGQVFNIDDELGTIESVKSVAEIYTPCSGEIVAVNSDVEDDPELINEDPHGTGWLVKIRFTAPTELQGLLNAEQYEQYVMAGE